MAEAANFRGQQRVLLKRGIRPRDEKFWLAEEEEIFGTAHSAPGTDFDSYDDAPVEMIGGQGTELIVGTFEEAIEQLHISEEVASNMKRCGYTKPTPVQKYAIPAAMTGTDVMVCSETGSGKTAAFLIPIIADAVRAGQRDVIEEGPVKPTCVIISPTRELCAQTAVEARRLSFRSHLRIVAIHGGDNTAKPQLMQLAEGCNIAVCTPGRLEDFLQRGVISFADVKTLVIDEVDRMLEMGFEFQLRDLLEKYDMPHPGTGQEGTRKTMMFSATFPQEMQDLALDFLDPSYMWICAGKAKSSPQNVEQRFEDVTFMEPEDQFDVLLKALSKVKSSDGGDARTIVFANAKITVDELAWQLYERGVQATQLHGDLAQEQRDTALNDLKEDRVRVLVATQVVARGLDLPNIEHVINYNCPRSCEEYVHRIGRTGRIGNRGVATTLIGLKDLALPEIVALLKQEKTEVPGWLEEQAKIMEMTTGALRQVRFRKRKGRPI